MISPLKTALLLSYICIASISAAIITPALPAIEHYYTLSHGALEWVVSIFLLGYVLGQLLYGPIANRYGRLRALQSGLLLNLVGICLCLLATEIPSYPLLLLGRLITALGAASGLSCTFILINEYLPPARAKHAMSFAIVSFTLGIGLAVFIGGIVTQYLNWKYCFWILLIHGVLMLSLTRLFEETLKNPITQHPREIILKLVQALKHRQLLVFSLVVGLVSASAYGYSAAAPIFAQNTLHLSASQYGYWNSINMIGMLGSGFLGAYLIKGYGAKRTLVIGLLCLLPVLVSLCVFSLVGSANKVWFFMTTTGLYLFSGLLFPAASYFASNAISDKASASSSMSFLNMGSAMISVVIMGYLPFSAVVAFTTTLVTFFILVILLVLPYLINPEKLVE
jgi:DHA1 family bicyclomycin/chloramphenicol resistance-like MFS transporter